ncbi:MAG: glutamate racemase [Elusimicrobia bacterium RIFOXYD12_FULL_66_9]|nr:MAG: glutamate racemase [Elusimicrobia bacterium RIFOXYD12_FULL_66_9]
MRKNAPIGVFDSGLGGLTVFKALARRMPEESLVYFGDTAHVPYGSKSPEAVTRYSVEIARFLAAKGIKLLVVACNTSSAVALPAIRRVVKVPVVGVIEPGARAAMRATHAGRIGVIGTEATMRSDAYPLALKSLGARVKTFSQACPLFVPLVEEGWWQGKVTEDVARRYMAPLRRARVDALILGCTHYPYLKPVLARVMGAKVSLIDSAEETALQTEAALGKVGMRSSSARRGRRDFYASDAPERFRHLARRMLGQTVPRVKLHTFDS